MCFTGRGGSSPVAMTHSKINISGFVRNLISLTHPGNLRLQSPPSPAGRGNEGVGDRVRNKSN
jgi:hypothetical protein